MPRGSGRLLEGLMLVRVDLRQEDALEEPGAEAPANYQTQRLEAHL
jgi:hypothetical protein